MLIISIFRKSHRYMFLNPGGQSKYTTLRGTIDGIISLSSLNIILLLLAALFIYRLYIVVYRKFEFNRLSLLTDSSLE